MAEKLRSEEKGYKVWKNPRGVKEPILFMGEFYPPDGQLFLTGGDLRQLGFEPGRYTILAPPNAPHSNLFSKWQTAVVAE
jgi:hypothetical protein